jgi:hypothetical protein
MDWAAGTGFWGLGKEIYSLENKQICPGCYHLSFTFLIQHFRNGVNVGAVATDSEQSVGRRDNIAAQTRFTASMNDGALLVVCSNSSP